MRLNATIIAFICGIICWSNIGFSQEKKIQLIGRVKGIDTGLVKIHSLLSDSAMNSSLTSYISKGRFVIHGKIAHPMRVFLVLNNSLYTDDFFIEPGSQNIYFDASNKDSFYRSFKITGSIVNNEYINAYQKPITPFYYSLDSCYTILDSLNKLGEKQENIYSNLINCIGIINNKIDSVKMAFIIKHPSSYVSLWNLYNSIGFLENLEFAVKSFNYLDKRLQKSFAGQKLSQRIEMQQAFLNEKIFPPMLVADSAKKQVAIQAIIKGKYTLIDFWFSHCGPCIVQFPLIRNLYAKYKDIGFDVIGISVDKLVNRKDWLDAIAKYELNWRQYWDVDEKEASKFFIDTFPTSFLLDSEGKIIKKNILLEELEILLAKHLK